MLHESLGLEKKSLGLGLKKSCLTAFITGGCW